MNLRDQFTLLVLPCGNIEKHQPRRVVERFNSICGGFVVFGHETENYLQKIKREREISSNWLGIMYSNEDIEDKLLEAIPIILGNKDTDVWVLAKKPNTWSPRFFSDKAVFSGYSLVPENKDQLEMNTVLNGWIFDVQD